MSHGVVAKSIFLTTKKARPTVLLGHTVNSSHTYASSIHGISICRVASCELKWGFFVASPLGKYI